MSTFYLRTKDKNIHCLMFERELTLLEIAEALNSDHKFVHFKCKSSSGESYELVINKDYIVSINEQSKIN